MDIRELLVVVRRRWKAAALLLTLTVMATGVLVLSVPESYTANARVIFEPPITISAEGEPANPLLGVGGSQLVVAKVIAEIVDDDLVRRDLAAAGASSYSVSPASESAALLEIETRSDDPDRAVTTLSVVSDALNRELQAQQRLSGADENVFITSRTLTSDTKASAQTDDRTRAGLVALGLGTVLSLTLVTVADSVLLRRRLRAAATGDGDLPYGRFGPARDAMAPVPALRHAPAGQPAGTFRLVLDPGPSDRAVEPRRPRQAGLDGG
jgi:capsular polysaccharide biosynthesis protein